MSGSLPPLMVVMQQGVDLDKVWRHPIPLLPPHGTPVPVLCLPPKLSGLVSPWIGWKLSRLICPLPVGSPLVRLSCGDPTPGGLSQSTALPLPSTYHHIALQWSYLTERASNFNHNITNKAKQSLEAVEHPGEAEPRLFHPFPGGLTLGLARPGGSFPEKVNVT